MDIRKILYSFSGFVAICCLCCMAISCQRHSYEFSYTPTEPKAGQNVTFSNLSDAGETWAWKFGDGSVSTMKNPTHVYTAPGTYVVELMVDSNKTRLASHAITVLDSIPSIQISTTEVRQYAPITMKAALYNPSKSAADYVWDVDESIFVITAGGLRKDSLSGYFTTFGTTTTVRMTVTVNGKTTTDTRELSLQDNPAPALLMRTATDEVWRQRIYETLYEHERLFDGDASALRSANDSTATLNGITYDIHNMPILKDRIVYALQLDAVNRKLYIVLDEGVYITNANGDNLTLIAETEAETLLIDATRNTLYWSDDKGVHAMPLVTNPLNTISEQMRAKIKRVNAISNVQTMTITQQ